MSTAPALFDPFQNRFCRHIRNDLSESFMQAIGQADMTPVFVAAQRYVSDTIAPLQQEYIATRLRRYQMVIDAIKTNNIRPDATYAVALLLWNQELFYEVHEWLERIWLTATGTEKEVAQALIRAAGTYVHLAHGRRAGAEKMAARAATTLLRHKTHVPPEFNGPVLAAKLNVLDPVPPKF